MAIVYQEPIQAFRFLVRVGDSQEISAAFSRFSGIKMDVETIWCPLTRVTLQVSESPADIASAVSAGDFFLSHAPLAVG